MDKERKQLLDAIWKKALGYTSTESIHEYAVKDGQMIVNKQKVTTKEIAPDIAAAKLIMDEMQLNPYLNLTDDELQQEKERLIMLLDKNKKQEKT